MCVVKSASKTLFILVLAFFAVQAGITSAKTATEKVNQALPIGNQVSSSSPIQAHLSIDNYPPVGESATVTCEVSSAIDASPVTAQIELPPNTRKPDGDYYWEGSLADDETVSFSATVVFDDTGDKAIFCRAHHVLDSENSFGDLAELYLSVEENKGEMGFAAVAVEERTQLGMLQEAGDGILLDETGEVLASPEEQTIDSLPGITPLQEEEQSLSQPEGSPDAPSGTLTVKGHWAYIDRNDDYTSAIESLVEIVRGDNRNHLAWCYTTNTGQYSCGPFSNPGSAGVRAIIYTFTRYNPYADVLAVVNPHVGTNPNNTRNLYSVQTGVTVFSDGTHDIGAWFVPDGSAYERAYWVQNDLLQTWRYIFLEAGGSESPVETAGPATVEWALDSTDGTYYERGGHIHLTGADPLSNTVVGHEYGHNIMFTVYGNSLPTTYCPTPHYINRVSHVNCGWTEGWADFLPLAVNRDPVYRWDSGASINLENPTWNNANWDDGDAVEGRIAGSLWDILDSRIDGDDQYSDGNIAAIWDTIYHQNDDNFAQFWAAWRARGHNNSSAGPLMSLFQNTIAYRVGPGNDDFAGAIAINSLPFTANTNTVNATTQGRDPSISCGSSSLPKQSRSVWYRFVPSTSRIYKISTEGSSYNTVVALWQGSFGSLVNSGCDNDGGAGNHASLTLLLNKNTTYYIEVTAYGGNAGGSLNLAVQQAEVKTYLPTVFKP